MLARMPSLFEITGESKIWTVSEINRYVRGVIEADYRLQDVWVRGEISNVSKPASGHLYFTLKDAQGKLSCVMWNAQVARLGPIPTEGDSLEIHGYVSVYEAGGRYQLYADSIRGSGEGELYGSFLELKEKLAAEGLFDADRKRPLPPLPRRVGVVTSATGAALQDVLDVLARRYPLAQVVLGPSPVQGAGAPERLRQALGAVNRAGVEVVLLVRGGGSMEDLAAFNDEGLARSVAASPAPVVSGVGHDTDFTIVDFVADLRAPTPSAAAELATPDRDQLLEQLQARRREMQLLMSTRLEARLRMLAAVEQRLIASSPQAKLDNERQRFDEVDRRLRRSLTAEIRLRRSRLDGLVKTLGAVGPRAVLARGYAIVERQQGDVIRSVSELAAGDQVGVTLHQGRFSARVEATENEQGSEKAGV